MTRTLAVVALLAAALWPGDTAAWPADPSVTDLSDPSTWPNDQDYDGQWWIWSFVPASIQDNVRPAEIPMGTGVHADRAWQITTGDRRIVIAVLDSGVYWNDPDYVNQLWLNRGELPPPEEACRTANYAGDPYDANGDGFFNVQDYTAESGHQTPTHPCDSRVSDVNGNGLIDPQDLIMIFSDGVDGDGNGYIDDISGWDFKDDDNDPYDDTRFGHGHGEMTLAAAEADNSRGGAGMCPSCRMFMCRTADGFIADSTRFAEAITYGVDNGASVFNVAMGGLTNTPQALAAIEYAWEEGVAISAATGDEDSFHQNIPGANNHTMNVHAVRLDSSSLGSATTFINFDNCSNYGAQVMMGVPSDSCASGATAITAGMSGILFAAALKADIPAPKTFATDPSQVRRLTSGEIRQLFIQTTYDIDVPESRGANADPTKYESLPGWDQRFQYGRPNLRRAVDEVMAGRIPPVVEFTEPLWFQRVDPDVTPNLDFVGEVWWRSDRYQSADLVFEWAAGIEPADSEFRTLDTRTITEPLSGSLYTWDVSALQIDNPSMPKPDVDVNRYMVTMRVRVVMHSSDGALDGVKGEARRAFHIHRDATLLPGFPKYLGASIESSPKTADLDGDGKREIVIGDSGGYVHAFRADGSELPGWPVETGLRPQLDPANDKNHRAAPGYANGRVPVEWKQAVFATIAIGDLDGDGKDEVVASTTDGQTFVYGADGTPRAGWPQGIDMADVRGAPSSDRVLERHFLAAPVLADLDGDGQLEVIQAGGDAKLHVWRHDGSKQPGFPVDLVEPNPPAEPMVARAVATPTVGDINGDGELEIVLGTNQVYNGISRAYAIRAQGNSAPGGAHVTGWPVDSSAVAVLPVIGTGMVNAGCMADIDGDGIAEVGIGGIGFPVGLYKGDGSLVRTMANANPGADSPITDLPAMPLVASPAIGDLNNDGKLEMALPAAGLKALAALASGGERVVYDQQMGVWDTTSGDFLKAWPQRNDDWQLFINPIIADIDGDNLPEIISGSSGYYLHAWNVDAKEPEGWPKFMGQWIAASAAVGDVDGDGKLEVIAGTRAGFLFVWKTTGKVTGRIDWESYHHDNANTGNYHTPLQQGVLKVAESKGCGCRAVDGGTPAGLALLGLLFLVRRRRRAC
jgi:MYXO-CTERM domain-containing protein